MGDQIIERIGPVAYCLALSLKFTRLHDISHVSMLKRYHPGPSHIIPRDEVQVQADMTSEEVPVEIFRWTDKVLHNKTIPMVKARWQHHTLEEATWELKNEMREKYLDMFKTNFGIKFF
ncbi:uncharacterized protein LOC110825056 [Carica papaya]|uniref:uncharacterized protein LOC110825056 n=1 Tax=Carica papaya TaxID=3649 RepID=UPI000B8C8751|nr:uncharacterized protein LOC110825056 [Carica papaya]